MPGRVATQVLRDGPAELEAVRDERYSALWAVAVAAAARGRRRSRRGGGEGTVMGYVGEDANEAREVLGPCIWTL